MTGRPCGNQRFPVVLAERPPGEWPERTTPHLGRRPGPGQPRATLRPPRGSAGGRPDSGPARAVFGWTHDAAPALAGRPEAVRPGVGEVWLPGPPGRPARRRGGRLLRRPEPHGGERGRSPRERRRRGRAGALPRDLRGAGPPEVRAAARRCRPGAERHLHLRPLAGDRRRARVAGLAPPGRLRRVPERAPDLRPGRDGHRGDVPRGSAASHGPRVHRHGHAALRRLSRAAAAGLHEPVRRDAELPRRLGPARGARPGPGGRTPVDPGGRDGAAGADARHGRRDRQPLLPRRRGR